MQISPYVAVNKTRSPTVQLTPLAVSNYSACQDKHRIKTSKDSRVSFQAQYQAFVRFAVGSSAAL
jgi:hypothetical protein